jgi:hypothetical protein
MEMNLSRHHVVQCFLLFGAAALFCLLVILPVGAGHAVEIPKAIFVHQQEEFFSDGRPIDVKTEVERSGPLRAARCYFRFSSDSGYLYIDLEGTPDGLLGTLPAPGPQIDRIEYFFLLVNDAGQVLRSQVYTKYRAAGREGKVPPVPGPGHFTLKTELGVAPSDPDDLFWHPDQVEVEVAGRQERYGLAAGLYQPDDFPGEKALPGYFGGFIMEEDGQAVPVEGLVLQSVSPALLDQPLYGQEDEPPPEPVEKVGPDIEGRWKGELSIDHDGVFTFFGYVTAAITQVGSQVTITTSLPYPLRPRYLAGTIDEYGNMLLYDEYGEDWSTHYGPATPTELTLADFMGRPSEEDPYPDLLVMHLQWQPPTSLLPTLYHLLLPSKADKQE